MHEVHAHVQRDASNIHVSSWALQVSCLWAIHVLWVGGSLSECRDPGLIDASMPFTHS